MFNSKRIMSLLFVLAITILFVANISIVSANANNTPTYTAEMLRNECNKYPTLHEFNMAMQGVRIIATGKIGRIDDPSFGNFRLITLEGGITFSLGNKDTSKAVQKLAVGQQISVRGYVGAEKSYDKVFFNMAANLVE